MERLINRGKLSFEFENSAVRREERIESIARVLRGVQSTVRIVCGGEYLEALSRARIAKVSKDGGIEIKKGITVEILAG